MGQEKDAHQQDPAERAEADRVARVYYEYRADPRKARTWDSSNRGNRAMRDEVAHLVLTRVAAVGGGERLIVDVGCGTGWWLARIAAAGVPARRLAGVDLLEQRVRVARERLPGARIERAAAGGLPFADASADVVSFFTVLSAMPSAAAGAQALAEAARIVAPGGTVVVWEPRVPTRNPHTRLVRLSEVRAALGDDLMVRSVTVAPPLARRAGRWYAALARVPALRTHRLVLAQPESSSHRSSVASSAASATS